MINLTTLFNRKELDENKFSKLKIVKDDGIVSIDDIVNFMESTIKFNYKYDLDNIIIDIYKENYYTKIKFYNKYQFVSELNNYIYKSIDEKGKCDLYINFKLKENYRKW